jgi:hypothetical protein
VKRGGAHSPGSVQTRRSMRDGSTFISLESRFLSLGLRPERGAKVSSLTDRRSGRNWLSVTDRAWTASTNVKWEDSDRAGWDECMPNIAPGLHPDSGVELPDHGEVWSRPWTFDQTPCGVRTQIRGVALPYELIRDISLGDETATVTYRLTNFAAELTHVGWAMHLLADIRPSAVRLPDDTPVRVDSTFGACGGVTEGEGWTNWRELADRLPMSETGWACKVFTRPGSVDLVDLVDKTGGLTVSIADTPTPATLGLWLNAGGWPSDEPLHHVGIEPGFGDHDDLRAARRSNSTLPVGGANTTTWSVRLHVSDSTSPAWASDAIRGRTT